MKTIARTCTARSQGRTKTSLTRRFLECALGGLLVFVNAAGAQELPIPTKTPAAESQASADTKQATPPTETKEEEKASKKAEQEKQEEKILHGASLVVAPIPIVSPALGSGIVPVAGFIFPSEENKKTPEPSVIGAAGLITNNGTPGWVLGSAIYLKEARYELKGGVRARKYRLQLVRPRIREWQRRIEIATGTDRRLLLP
jgi:hypothetical protein